MQIKNLTLEVEACSDHGKIHLLIHSFFCLKVYLDFKAKFNVRKRLNRYVSLTTEPSAGGSGTRTG